MNFTYEKHLENLSEDPKSASITWHHLISLARYQIKTQQWQKAIISYGNALDTAQIIFEQDSTSFEIKRYIQTATELIYSIRQCDYPCDFQIFIAIIEKKLQKKFFPAKAKSLLRPLTDIAYSPLSEVNLWMKTTLTSRQQDHIYH